MYQILTVNESSCCCTYEGIQTQMANNSWTIPIRIGNMVKHFQLPTYEYHWATRQARDTAISANSLGTWFFYKEQLCGQYRTSLRNDLVQNRVERGRLPTCGLTLYSSFVHGGRAGTPPQVNGQFGPIMRRGKKDEVLTCRMFSTS